MHNPRNENSMPCIALSMPAGSRISLTADKSVNIFYEKAEEESAAILLCRRNII